MDISRAMQWSPNTSILENYQFYMYYPNSEPRQQEEEYTTEAYEHENNDSDNNNDDTKPDTANDAYAHLYPPSTPLTQEELRSYTFFCAPPHFLNQYSALNPANDEFIINGSYVGDGIWRAQIIYAPAVRVIFESDEVDTREA